MTITNPWKENEYFEVENPIYQNGDFRIFKQFDKCYLHTFKNMAFNQLMKPNKELIQHHIDQIRPKEKPLSFIYDAGKKHIDKVRTVQSAQVFQQTLFL